MSTVQVMTPDDFLEHYGVKGMKWGVRKEREPLTRKQKTAIVAGSAVVVGAAAAAIVLGSTGRLPTSQIQTAVSAAAKVRGALRATPNTQSAQTIRRVETSYMLKAVPGYNPRSNQYSREYQQLQIGR